MTLIRDSISPWTAKSRFIVFVTMTFLHPGGPANNH